MGTLGAWEIPGEPGAVLAVADRLGSIAEGVSDVAQRVRAGDLDGSWTGPAADAFQTLLQELPGDLDKVAHAHEAARSALAGFGHELQGMKSRAASIASQLDAERTRAAQAAARHAAAKKRTVTAQGEHLTSVADPVAHQAAGQRLAAAKTELAAAGRSKDAASGSVAGLEKQARALREQYEAAARAAERHVREACTLSLKERWDAGYARYVEGTVIDMALEAVLWPIKSVADAIRAVGDFVKNPTWTAARDIIDGIGTVLTVAAIAIALGVSLPVSMGVILGLGVVVAAVKLGTTIAAVKEEGLPPEEIVGDVMGLFLAGRSAGALRSAAKGAATKGARTHYVRYGIGYNPLTNIAKQDALDNYAEQGIVKFLVNLEWNAAEFLLGDIPEAPTTWTPARDPGRASMLQTPNVTVRHHIALRVPAPQAAVA